MYIRAVEVTDRIGKLSHTTRYEVENSEPVEIWEHKGKLYVVPESKVHAGDFPWKEEHAAR
jgi:hypothetical protein